MLLRRFVRKHPRRENRTGNRSCVPIVVVEVDGPNEGQLCTAIWTTSDSPYPPNARVDAEKDEALHQMRHAGAKMLIIDEFHNLLAGPASQQSHFRNVVKLFSNVLQIPIIAAGTELAYNALQADEQLANRFYPLELQRWSDGEDYARLLLSIRRSWEIELDVDALSLEILARTNRTIGAITELLEWVAIWSLRNRGTAVVDLEAIKEYPFASLSELSKTRT